MKRKILMGWLAILLVAVPLLGSFSKEAAAASTRVAVIKELKGTVKVKKAGGSKEFTAFAKMSLNEGDVLAVGSGGSAVLQFANGTSEDDKMTVASNTKLTFSKLSNKKGTTTKVSMWSGSAWVDVKSITNKEDQFTLETPTAVMGVRGTHLLVTVNPNTGATSLMVAAGVVQTTSTGGGGEAQSVYPTQNALITKEGNDSSDITIAPADLETLMKQGDAEIVKAIIQGAADITAENEQYVQRYENGEVPKEIGGTSADLERFKNNTQNLLGALATKAVETGLITQERMNQLIEEAGNQTGFKVDLTKSSLQLTEAEKAKQEAQRQKEEAEAKLAEALKAQAEAERKKNEETLRLLEEARKAKEKAALEAAEAKKKQAMEKYESQLSEAERNRVREEAEKRKAETKAAQNNASPTPSPSPSPSPSSSPSQAPVLSGNANLSGLTVSVDSSPLTLSPPFSISNVSFAATFPASATQVRVAPVVADTGKATVKVNGASLSGGFATVDVGTGPSKVVDVVVTAENGTTKTYRVTLTRASSNNANLSELSVSLPGSTQNLIAFGQSENTYTISVPNTTGTIAIKPVVEQSNATVKVNNLPITSGSETLVTLVSSGTSADTTTTIPVVVTAQNGTTKTYTVIVNRQASLLTETVIGIEGFKLDQGFYSYTVPNNTLELKLNFGSLAPGVSVVVEVNGTAVYKEMETGNFYVPLDVGMNTIVITVTSGGTAAVASITDLGMLGALPTGDQTYTLNVTRALPELIHAVSLSYGDMGYLHAVPVGNHEFVAHAGAETHGAVGFEIYPYLANEGLSFEVFRLVDGARISANDELPIDSETGNIVEDWYDFVIVVDGEEIEPVEYQLDLYVGDELPALLRGFSVTTDTGVVSGVAYFDPSMLFVEVGEESTIRFKANALPAGVQLDSVLLSTEGMIEDVLQPEEGYYSIPADTYSNVVAVLSSGGRKWSYSIRFMPNFDPDLYRVSLYKMEGGEYEGEYVHVGDIDIDETGSGTYNVSEDLLLQDLYLIPLYDNGSPFTKVVINGQVLPPVSEQKFRLAEFSSAMTIPISLTSPSGKFSHTYTINLGVAEPEPPAPPQLASAKIYSTNTWEYLPITINDLMNVVFDPSMLMPTMPPRLDLGLELVPKDNGQSVKVYHGQEQIFPTDGKYLFPYYGSNMTFTIVVTSADGESSKEYTFVVSPYSISNAGINNFKIGDYYVLYSAVDGADYYYVIPEVSGEQEQFALDDVSFGIAPNASATVKLNGSTDGVNYDAQQHNYDFVLNNADSNVITIEVTAEAGNKETYNLYVVKNHSPHNLVLNDIEIRAGNSTYSSGGFFSNITKYYWYNSNGNLNKEDESIAIKLAYGDGSEGVHSRVYADDGTELTPGGNGDFEHNKLHFGHNNFYIDVFEPQDKYYQHYFYNVWRDGQIEVWDADGMAPISSKSYTASNNIELTIPYDTTRLTFKTLLNSPGATIKAKYKVGDNAYEEFSVFNDDSYSDEFSFTQSTDTIVLEIYQPNTPYYTYTIHLVRAAQQAATPGYLSNLSTGSTGDPGAEMFMITPLTVGERTFLSMYKGNVPVSFNMIAEKTAGSGDMHVYLNDSNDPIIESGNEYFLENMLNGWNHVDISVDDSHNSGNPTNYKYWIWVGTNPTADYALNDVYAEDVDEQPVNFEQDPTDAFQWSTMLDYQSAHLDVSGQFPENSSAHVVKLINAEGGMAEQDGSFFRLALDPDGHTEAQMWVENNGLILVYRLVIESEPIALLGDASLSWGLSYNESELIPAGFTRDYYHTSFNIPLIDVNEAVTLRLTKHDETSGIDFVELNGSTVTGSVYGDGVEDYPLYLKVGSNHFVARLSVGEMNQTYDFYMIALPSHIEAVISSVEEESIDWHYGLADQLYAEVEFGQNQLHLEIAAEEGYTIEFSGNSDYDPVSGTWSNLHTGLNTLSVHVSDGNGWDKVYTLNVTVGGSA